MLFNNLQQLIVILAAAAQIISHVRDWRKSKTADQPIGGSQIIRLAPDLLDLSFVLLFASLVSFLLTDSLLISGRIVTLGFWLIFEAAILVFAIGGLLYLSYRQGKPVGAVGMLSGATLLVLFAAPGGPFHQPQEGADAGPSLLWTTLTLLTICSAALFHEFGGPFFRGRILRSRVIALSTVAAMTVLSALALGLQFAAGVGEELTPEGTEFLADIREPSVQPETRKRVYQVLSDYQLASQYEDQFNGVQHELEDIKNQPDTGPLANPLGDPVAQSILAGQILSKRIEGRKRLEFINGIVEGFNRLDFVDQLNFEKDRLGFVHPLGDFNNRRAPLPLPGRKAADRYKATSDLRQIRGLSISGRPQSLIGDHGFVYDAAVLRYFRTPVSAPFERDKEILPERLPRYLDVLFPKAPRNAYAATFDSQLILPTAYEAYIAYTEYRNLAGEYIKSHLPPQIRDLTAAIDRLPTDTKRVYRHYDDFVRQRGGNDSDLPAMLAEFSDLDFTPIRGDNGIILMYKLFAPQPPADAGLATLYEQLSHKSRKSRDLLKQLADEGNLQLRLSSLLDPALLVIAQKASSAGFDKVPFSQFMANPVTVGLQELIDKSEDSLEKKLEGKAQKLSDSERESVLFFMATSLYGDGGAFTPSIFSRLVLEAGLIGKAFQDFAAALLYLPVLAICIFAGDFCARRLAARETLHSMMSSETEEAVESSTLAGKAVELIGREPIFDRLQKLARRGWSTIALAGRRGVGKSRMLQKLQESYKHGSIVVWMFAPARFSETEFVEDVFERLATATEEAIGRFIGAKPLIVRSLEARSSRIGAAMFAVCFCCVSLLVAVTSTQPARPELAISWIPAGALMIASAIAVILYFRRLQPADLSSWIERESKIDSQLVWLYRDTAEALRFIAARKTSGRPSVELWGERPSLGAAFFLGGLAFTSFLLAAFTLFDDNPDSDTNWAILIFSVLGVGFLLALMVFFRRKMTRPKGTEVGRSLIMLVERYREFAATTVRRIKKGAFGPTNDQPGVVVCIDELDKIVDFNELRDFIRTVKSIFEIPGVSYYLSISEDALAALHLGSSLGKNEVDSAFDHIITVPPLSLEAAEELASKYIEFLKQGTPAEGVARMIAAMSFGVPRDIVRRCDELAEIIGQASPEEVVQQWLGVQIDMGEASGFLSADLVTRLRGKSGERLELLLKELSRNQERESVCRYLLLLGVLILLFEISGTAEEAWRERSRKLCSFGYGLPTRPVPELRSGFEGLAADFQ